MSEEKLLFIKIVDLKKKSELVGTKGKSRK